MYMNIIADVHVIQMFPVMKYDFYHPITLYYYSSECI